jgi:hypothetical protein
MLRFGAEHSNSESQNIAKEIDRFQRLAADLEPLALGELPKFDDGSEVPMLEKWYLTTRAVPCLVGLSTGHPKLLGTRREILTSELIAFSPQLSCARTKSRWYHLGVPGGVA